MLKPLYWPIFLSDGKTMNSKYYSRLIASLQTEFHRSKRLGTYCFCRTMQRHTLQLLHKPPFRIAASKHCRILLIHQIWHPQTYVLFPEMKRHLKGRRFHDREDICRATKKWLSSQPPHAYFQGQGEMGEVCNFGC